MKSMIEINKLDYTVNDINHKVVQAKELGKSTVLRTLMGLKPEFFNEAHWSGKCEIL